MVWWCEWYLSVWQVKHCWVWLVTSWVKKSIHNLIFHRISSWQSISFLYSTVYTHTQIILHIKHTVIVIHGFTISFFFFYDLNFFVISDKRGFAKFWLTRQPLIINIYFLQWNLQSHYNKVAQYKAQIYESSFSPCK